MLKNNRNSSQNRESNGKDILSSVFFRAGKPLFIIEAFLFLISILIFANNGDFHVLVFTIGIIPLILSFLVLPSILPGRIIVRIINHPFFILTATFELALFALFLENSWEGLLFALIFIFYSKIMFFFLPRAFSGNRIIRRVRSLEFVSLSLLAYIGLIVYMVAGNRYALIVFSGIFILMAAFLVLPSISPGNHTARNPNSCFFLMAASLSLLLLCLFFGNKEHSAFLLLTIVSSIAAMVFFLPTVFFKNIFALCLTVFITFSALFLMLLFSVPAFCILFVFVVSGLFVKKILPGNTFLWSAGNIIKKPLFRSNIRITILLELDILLIFIFCVIPFLFFGMLVDRHIRMLPSRDIIGTQKGARVPYQIYLDPDGEYLYATFCHTEKAGTGRVDLRGSSPYKLQFNYYRNEHGPCYANIIPSRNILIAHSYYMKEFSNASKNRSGAAHVVDMKTFKENTLSLGYMDDPQCSTYNPETGEIYIVEKNTPALRVMKLDDFLNGLKQKSKVWSLDGVFGPDGIMSAPQKNTVYLRGEFGPYFVEMNVKTGKRRSILLPKSIWDMTVDRDKGYLYLTRPMSYRFDVVDIEKFRLVRKVFIGGMSRPICYLEGKRKVAVGMYFGNRILIYDTETFKPVYTVRTCARVRSMAYKSGSNELYYSDNWGIHVVDIPE